MPLEDGVERSKLVTDIILMLVNRRRDPNSVVLRRGGWSSEMLRREHQNVPWIEKSRKPRWCYGGLTEWLGTWETDKGSFQWEVLCNIPLRGLESRKGFRDRERPAACRLRCSQCRG